MSDEEESLHAKVRLGCLFHLFSGDTPSNQVVNSRIRWNSYATLGHRLYFYSTKRNWIPWPLRLSHYLITHRRTDTDKLYYDSSIWGYSAVIYNNKKRLCC